jgi:hypothetical protein
MTDPEGAELTSRLRVVNKCRGEIVGDYASNQFELAKQHADRLAEAQGQVLEVHQVAVVYRTKPKK